MKAIVAKQCHWHIKKTLKLDCFLAKV